MGNGALSFPGNREKQGHSTFKVYLDTIKLLNRWLPHRVRLTHLLMGKKVHTCKETVYFNGFFYEINDLQDMNHHFDMYILKICVFIHQDCLKQSRPFQFIDSESYNRLQSSPRITNPQILISGHLKYRAVTELRRIVRAVVRSVSNLEEGQGECKPRRHLSLGTA